MEKRVNVLLATYNGSRFLSDQLQSIHSQTCSVARVTIRDDGSTDDTNLQLENWAASHPIVSLLRGSRLGAANNFFTLLMNADANCDYFAFCDQDDVWLPDKLERAVVMLRECAFDGPAMYCSRVEFVGEELEHLGYSKIPKRVGFENALVENVVTGCTIVLNGEARRIILEHLPAIALMHDWWCYLVISALGKVVYDERPSLKYRLHGRNAVGLPTNRIQKLRWRISRFLKYDRGIPRLADQAEEFRGCFGASLEPEKLKALNRFLAVRGNVWSRANYSARMDVWRQSWIDTAILRTMILIGRV